MGLLSNLLGTSAGKPTEYAGGQNIKLLNDLKSEGMGYIDQGKSEAQGYLEQQRGAYTPLSQLGMSGANLYADALGINGQDAATAAQGSFTASPAYQFNLDQGLQALERRAAAQGRLQSGQTGIDTLGFAQGLASNEWGNWMDRLGGYNNLAMGAAQGEAGALGNLASLASGTAGMKTDFAGDIVSGLMGANNQIAQGNEYGRAKSGAALGGLLNTGVQAAGVVAGYGGFGQLPQAGYGRVY